MTNEASVPGVTGQRASGILLHPTSLPGGYGNGDLGRPAYEFVDFLVAARQSLWQVLPLNPVGSGHSPYASPAAFAGNPALISIDALVTDGLADAGDCADVPVFPHHRADYDRGWTFKLPILQRAWQRFAREAGPRLRHAYAEFCSRHRAWLEAYALFVALHKRERAPWTSWPRPLAARVDDVLARARDELAEEIDFQRFLQFVYHSQWSQLHQYANRNGVRIVGDLPIFVAPDSVDVWTDPGLFYLDRNGKPSVVSGVPPDYFSATGQRWGNPLYRWDELAERGYDWWVARFRSALAEVDAVRIDHFRGFQAFWQVPGSHETAKYGRWVPGPGIGLFDRVEAELGRLPIIVEDLGSITPDVEELRDKLGYPGMKVLQFAFDGDAGNPYLPHNYSRRCVVYTATHDNDTSAGWFATLSPVQRAKVRRYVGTSGRDVAFDLIRLALASVADLAIVPMQDVLGLGSAARMNYPGKAEGNWVWRYSLDQLTTSHSQRLGELTMTYGRDVTSARRNVL